MREPLRDFLKWFGAAASVLLLTSLAGILRGRLARPEMHFWIGLEIGAAYIILLACFYVLLMCDVVPQAEGIA